MVDSRRMSAATFVEVSIVIESRFGSEGLRSLDRFIERAGIEVIAVDIEQARAAREAFTRFGKGRHAAGLNFGDCFPMRWREFSESRCFSKARIFPALTSCFPTPR